MKPFDYVSVIISVVIGLGLSHLLSGFVELFKLRGRVRFYWLHTLWAVLTFLGGVFLWWSLWNLREMRVWNFFSFVMLLFEPVMIFIVAAFLIPKPNAVDYKDMREYFYENHSAIFGANAVFTLLLLVQNGILAGGRIFTAFNGLIALALALFCGGALTKNARYHAALGLFLTLWFLLFIVLFGLNLGSS